MMRSLSAATRVFVAVCLLTQGASASILFSNLGPGDAYSQSGGWGVDWLHDVAGSFKPSATEPLGTIELGLRYSPYISPPRNAFHVLLAADAGGSPGTVIEDFGAAYSLTANGVASNSLVTVTSSAHPTLTAGTRYWVQVLGYPLDPNQGSVTAGSWNYNPTGDSSPVEIRYNGGAWQAGGGSSPAFRVTGAVPEPGTALLAMIAVGLLGAAWSRRRRPATTNDA